MKRFLPAVIAILAVCGTGIKSGIAQSTQSDITSTSTESLAEFQKVEDVWSTAMNKRDQYGLELVLSPLFVDIAASGDIATRNQIVAYQISAPDKTLRLEQKVITVRTMGDVAVVNGTYVLHHQAEGGPVDEKGVFTHVFEKNRNRWVCMNSQRTLVREDAGGKTRKGSKSEHSFHLPNSLKHDEKQQ